MLPRNNPSLETLRPFYNPKITKVEVTIEGIPNQLYSQGMRAYQMWDEAKEYFAASPGNKRHPEVGTVAKDLAMADVNLGDFLTSKYSLSLDLRTSDDDRLHGSGRRTDAKAYDPDHKESSGRCFEHLFFCRHGCATQYQRWPVRLSGLLTSCHRRLIRRRYAGGRDVEKQFSSWTCSKAPTGGPFNTSWSCAQPYGITRPISSVPGSRRTPRSTFSTPVSASTITC